LKIFIDGVERGQTNIEGLIPYTESNDLTMGRFGERDVEYFEGSIDEVRIYNRALSDTEIECLNDYPCGVPLAKTVISPNPMYAFMLTRIEPMDATIYLGDFMDGHSIYDVDTNSILINGLILPYTVNILPMHPEFQGEVLEILFDIGPFINYYMLLWDWTTQTYLISGSFQDETPFSINGKISMRGHTSR